MNEIIKRIINEMLEEVNTLDSPVASFGAGAAVGVLIKNLDEYENNIFDQGFEEGLECAENVIMYGNYDFVRKMFSEEKKDYDVLDLINKFGLREVNKKYMEYINESGREHQMAERQN